MSKCDVGRTHLAEHLLPGQILGLVSPDLGQIKPGSVRLGRSHGVRSLLLRKFLRIMSSRIHEFRFITINKNFTREHEPRWFLSFYLATDADI